MECEIDFFFFYGSTYTYLTVMRIENLAAGHGVKIRWRPFNVRQIMLEQDNIPFRDKPVKAQYMWRDIERRAVRYGIPFNGVPPYPVDPDNLAGRVGLVAAREGWCPAYTRTTYGTWFLEHNKPGDPVQLARALSAIGKSPDAVIDRAESPEVREEYDAETQRARELGIFGSPTFRAGDEIFWGDDRLEDALEWALATKG